jgi:NADPH2:quinone reductase
VHYIAAREELLWRAGEVLSLAASGALNVRISKTYPLASAGDAHRDLESRTTTGALVLNVRDDL